MEKNLLQIDERLEKIQKNEGISTVSLCVNGQNNTLLSFMDKRYLENKCHVSGQYAAVARDIEGGK